MYSGSTYRQEDRTWSKLSAPHFPSPGALMKILFAFLIAALFVVAGPARGQSIPADSAAAGLASTPLDRLALAPPAPLLTPSGADELLSPAPFPAVWMDPHKKRPWWRYPLIGAAIGTVAGGVVAIFDNQQCKKNHPEIDMLGCEAAFVFDPAAGLAAGAVVGFIVHLVNPQ